MQRPNSLSKELFTFTIDLRNSKLLLRFMYIKTIDLRNSKVVIVLLCISSYATLSFKTISYPIYSPNLFYIHVKGPFPSTEADNHRWFIEKLF